MNNQFLRIFGLLAFFGLTMFQSLQAQCGGFNPSITTLTSPSCSNFNGGSAAMMFWGGTAPFSYAWSNMFSMSISTGSTVNSSHTITGLPSGNTFVTITDANGCMARQTVQVPSYSSLATSFYSVTNPSCGNANGTLGVQLLNGTAPYSYLWNTGATTSFITNRPAGTYTVTITDANGCNASTSRTLTATGANFSVSIQDTTPSCSNNQNLLRIVSGTPAFPWTTLWSNGSQISSAQYIAGQTASITVTDANGCTATNSLQVSNASNLQVTAIPTNTGCTSASLGSATTQISGGQAPYVYVWRNLSFGAQIGNAVSISNLANNAGYSVEVTDAYGCSGIDTVFLQPNNNSIFVEIFDSTYNACATSRLLYTTMPYQNYLWSNGATTSYATYNAGQWADVTVTNANGCQGVDSFYVQNTGSGLQVQATATNTGCTSASLGSATAQVFGGQAPYVYVWRNLSFGAQIGNAASISNLANNAGYSVQVTDANGCSGIDTVFLQPNNGSIFVQILDSTHNSCATTRLLYTTMPYQNYLWSNGATTAYASYNAGQWAVVTATNANGCQGVDSFYVQGSNGSLQVNATATNTGCTSASLGSATAQVSGGQAPYAYVWRNLSFGAQIGNAASISNLANNAGYSVQVTDANGCSGIDTVFLQPNNGSIFVQILDSTPNACATTRLLYTTMPYQNYIWSNGATTAYASYNAGQWAVVTVTNANGCQGVDSFYVQAGGNNFTVSLYDSSTNCNDSIRMIAVANLQGFFGQGFTVFAWSNGSQNAFGDYQIGDLAEVTITNPSTGCQVVGQYYVSPSVGTISFWGMTNNTNCTSTASTGSIFVSGNGQYQYLWSTGATTSSTSGMSSSSSIQNLAQGWYGLTVTDGNSCENTVDFYVDVDSNCYQLISGYAYLLQQQAPSNCQPNNTPCMYCEIAIDNGTTVDYVFTDNNGYYEYSTSNVGVHTISFANTNMLSAHSISCPSNNSISVTLAAAGSYINNNFFIYIAPTLELVLSQYNISNIVPGFQHIQFADICNYSDITANGTYTFNYPAGVQFSQYLAMAWNTASLASVSVSHNSSTRTVTINFTGLPAYNCFGYELIFDVDTTLTIGDTLCFTANVDMTNGTEPDLTNNSYAACLPVETSYDPNDKRVTNHSGGDQKRGTISPAQTDLHYVIRFQNTGTAPARRVIIRDDLAATLLPNTISNIASSHPCQLQIIDGQLVATFLNLNLLPQSASEALSQGFVSFNIQRQAGLPVGTRIDNTASIFFDYNSPIVTNTAQTTIAQMVAVAETRAAEMSLQVMPNPFNGQLSVAYELATDSKVRVSLINILGETVIQVANNTQTAGNQQFSINTQDLGAGVYYLMVETEAGRFAQKVIKQ